MQWSTVAAPHLSPSLFVFFRWKNEQKKLALVRAKFKSAYVFSKQVGDMFIGTDAIELQVRERERERREREEKVKRERRAGREELGVES